MKSLFDAPLLLFIFAPPLLTMAIVLAILGRKVRMQRALGAAEGMLAAAIEGMPPERAEWGKAMLAELNHLPGAWTRFRFALGSARASLFPPHSTAAPLESPRYVVSRGPYCGMLAVGLPPLALPFLFLTAVVADSLFHGLGDSTSHAMPAALVSACLITGLALLLSGLPLGLASWYRGERCLWLTALGPILSVVFAGYLWMFLYLFAVGPNGD
ncbi:MAG: hypothetical protein AB7G28_00200 [Pirellulales bacterium]